ncbi:hypothetical protein LMG27174_07173 [Paraburkholderia rhynchosiae]|uniref:Uncharacterized protein n=1 Tax=Paraburkholderia rhynchosiae TaxID=487049 RepID=A0A6J5CTJ7_9BURK|nr:hypothetical protein LMG27174_07173 [Paraburkholderia rhynchosiae]
MSTTEERRPRPLYISSGTGEEAESVACIPMGVGVYNRCSHKF